MIRKYSFHYIFAVIFLIALLSIFIGCSHINRSFLGTMDISNRNLPISLLVDEESSTVVFTSDKLNGNFTEGLQYTLVSNVMIHIDGESIKLEDAIRDRYITAEEIFCFARLDARAGTCRETYESSNGLAHFTYYYPEYTLRLIYDVYETPDGQQHLISDMGLYPPERTTIGTYRYFYLGGTNILRYDYEDWGLSFNITDISPSGVRIMVNQTEGQQIGEIKLHAYDLWKDETTPVAKLSGNRESEYLDSYINMDGDTEIIINWTDAYGDLPSGEYLLDLTFVDVYSASDVHPLMRNYYDDMGYLLEISIP